jgi:transcriptional regulator with XRE-family HTH domain
MGGTVKLYLGLAVRKIRKGTGYSLDGVSILSGVSKSHLSNIETGKREPTLEMLERICVVLEINVSELFIEAEQYSHGIPTKLGTSE